MRRWYIPSWCGDFRLEATGPTCKLTVEDPTAKDLKRLKPFLKEARKQAWIGAEAGISDTGLSTLTVSADIMTAGSVLAGVTSEGATWTAVKSTSGKITVVSGAALTPEIVQSKPDAAVTVKQNYKGCPAPESWARRASEVLTEFSTPEQIDQWNCEGRMRIYGSHTGRLYWLYHRDEAAKRKLPRLLFLGDTNEAVCVWQDTLPPEEEALSIKLGVENREPEALRGAYAKHGYAYPRDTH